jgi:hypothetical protein
MARKEKLERVERVFRHASLDPVLSVVLERESQLLELTPRRSADEVAAVNTGCLLKDLLHRKPGATDLDRMAPYGLRGHTYESLLDLASAQLEEPPVHGEAHYRLVLHLASEVDILLITILTDGLAGDKDRRPQVRESRGLSLDTIRSRRLPGVGTGPAGEMVPLYTSAATGPEVTHYLVSMLDEAIELLRRARGTATSEMQAEIDNYIERV